MLSLVHIKDTPTLAQVCLGRVGRVSLGGVRGGTATGRNVAIMSRAREKDCKGLVQVTHILLLGGVLDKGQGKGQQGRLGEIRRGVKECSSNWQPAGDVKVWFRSHTFPRSL